MVDNGYSRETRPRVPIGKAYDGDRKVQVGVYRGFRQVGDRHEWYPADTVKPGHMYYARYNRGYHPAIADENGVLHFVQPSQMHDRIGAR